MVLPIASGQTPPEGEVYELAPFEVLGTAGQGYLITQTTSATRFAADRRDLPFAIATISSDLLDDLAVVDSSEALDLTSSATPEGNVFTGADNRPSIRGTSSARFFVEGIFFNSTEAPGGIAIDRIEILKGTSAMLYGQGEPGGTVNYMLKRPSRDFSGRVQVLGGSFDQREFRVELTGPLTRDRNLAAFVGWSHFMGGGPHDRFFQDSRNGFARLRWEYGGPNRFLDVYHVYSYNRREGIVQSVLDGFNGVTNLGMQRDIFQRFTSQGLPNPLELGMIDPKSHNDAVEGSFANIRSNSSTATWNHGFADRFTVRLSYNRTEMPRYLWRNLADPMDYVETRASRSYLLTDPETGLPEVINVVRGDLVKNSGGRLRDDSLISDSFVFNLLGDFEVGPLSLRTVVGIDHITEAFETESFFSSWHYRQLANGGSALAPFGDRIPIILGNVLRPEEGLRMISEPLETYTIHGGANRNNNEGTGYYATGFLQALGGDLSIVGSVRHDRTELSSVAFRPARTDGLDPVIGGVPFNFNATTYSIGANYLLFRNWGVFANYATTFRPEASFRDGRNRMPIPVDERRPFEGKGWDAGIKFATMDGRFFAMATAFQTKKLNVWTRLRGQEIDLEGNLVWLDEDQTVPSLISYEAQAGEQLAEGVELELAGALLRNLEVRFGWTWLAAAKISKDEDPVLVGQRLRSSPEHRLSAQLNYRIREGWLGLANMGVNVTALIDNRIYWVDPNTRVLNRGSLGDDNPFVGEVDRFWSKGHTRVDVFFARRFVLPDGKHLWLRANVFNVLDEDHQRFRQRGTPRSFRLSADMRF